MRRKHLVAGLVVTVAAAALLFAQDSDDAPATAIVIAFTKAGQDTTKSLEKDVLAPLKKEAEEKDVLFVQAETGTPAARNQSRLLLEALGFGEMWRMYAGKPGTIVLINAQTGDTVRAFTAKDGAKGVLGEIEKLRAASGEDEGCGDGCGCGEEDGCG